MTAAAAGGDAEAPPPARGRWSDPSWAHQRPLTPGPGAWRSSAR
ncbi:acyl-CoA carboxylase epsilon subunit [Jatrophihabitans cynanchi]